jgi:predicted SAM-dependent methyltransferase
MGSGSSRDRRIAVNGKRDWTKLVTLDSNPDHKPNVVHDLESLPWPFEDNSFQELHGYEIWEHLGRQGDARSFFAHFSEAYRILAPGGFLVATCPSYRSMWAFGDPSHTRVITSGSLVFLDQQQYQIQVDTPETRTAMSDFRQIWKGDFRAVWVNLKGEEDGSGFSFVLQAVKPSRLRIDSPGLQGVESM